MFDSYNRDISYLRVSVTDRCNLRCTYCMPEEGIKLLNHAEILTFEEIEAITREAVNLGIKKVRITGGEPLVRKGITRLVAMLAGIEGITDLAMTTNAVLLAGFARELKAAGLMRINVSLDTINPIAFRNITRGGDIREVLKGIEAAVQAGLTPLKINCVVKDSSLEPEALEVAEYARANGLEIRYIHQMNLKEGHFSVVEGGEGGNCSRCNRLRLTANGYIKPCLFNDLSYNARELGAKEAIRQAIRHKPGAGSHNCTGQFYNIGG